MVRTFFRFFIAVTVVAALAWAANRGGATFLLAAALLLVGACVLSLVLWSASRSRRDILHDSTISTLVFPPSSQLQRPPR